MNPRLAYSLVVAFIVISFSIGLSVARKDCAEVYRHDKTIMVNGQVVEVQLAKTELARERGLGGKICLGDKQGMLFQFNQPGNYPFWMKDMRFPIDIVWISTNHRVVGVAANVLPSSYPKTYVSQQPAQDVLELDAGQAARIGLKEGTLLHY